MPPTEPGQMATVLVALAWTELSPSQISAGKDTRVPPPATELIMPAMKAAVNATAVWVRLNGMDFSGAGYKPNRPGRHYDKLEEADWKSAAG